MQNFFHAPQALTGIESIDRNILRLFSQWISGEISHAQISASYCNRIDAQKQIVCQSTEIKSIERCLALGILISNWQTLLFASRFVEGNEPQQKLELIRSIEKSEVSVRRRSSNLDSLASRWLAGHDCTEQLLEKLADNRDRLIQELFLLPKVPESKKKFVGAMGQLSATFKLIEVLVYAHENKVSCTQERKNVFEEFENRLKARKLPSFDGRQLMG